MVGRISRIAAFAFLAVALLASAGHARTFPLIARGQRCSGGHCEQFANQGTATAIGRLQVGTEYLLTNAHCVQPRAGEQILSVAVKLGDDLVAARVLGKWYDSTADLALISVQSRPLNCWPIAEKRPPLHSTVAFEGFGGGTWQRVNARLTSLSGRENLVLDQQSIDGQSGGPVHHDEKLIGLIWGGPMGSDGRPMQQAYATPVETIRQFIARTIGRMPTCAVPGRPPVRIPPQPPTAPPVDRTGELIAKIAELESRLNQLEQRPAPRDGTDGANGRDGKPGPAGKVTVIIQDDGREVGRHEALDSGSAVVVDITRFRKE